jgi:PST family polysaccharide transporter
MQVVVLVGVVPLAMHEWGVMGVARGMTVGLATAGLWMLYRAFKPR